MPALVLKHVEDLRCTTCGATLATAGSRSTITNQRGDIILFDDQDPPTQLIITIICANGHRTDPPDSVDFELGGVDMKAPKATNAVALRGSSRSGRPITFD
jgi:hypothetical protein